MGQLRAYFFNNMYLTGIHAGIQAQHCTAEMFTRYDGDTSEAAFQLYRWADIDKATIILNAGHAENLTRIFGVMSDQTNPYACAEFHESHAALNNCITSVGIILPRKVYDYEGACLEAYAHNLPLPELTKFEHTIREELIKCKLMT